MLKDRFLKAFGGLIALATIAFASLPSDALGVSASNDYSDNPYCLGAFDSLDYSNEVVVRQTAYLDFVGVSTWTYAGLDERYIISWDTFILAGSYSVGTSWNGSTYSRGIGVCNCAYWADVPSSPQTSSREVPQLFFNGSRTELVLLIPHSLGYIDLTSFGSFISSNDGLHIQYLTASSTTETFADAITGDNCADAFADGYASGSSDGYKDGYLDGLKAGPSTSQPSISVSPASHVASTNVNPLYDDYFDKTRDVTGWTLFSSQMTIYDYNYRSLAFYTTFTLSGITLDVGSMYMFRFVGDANGYVSLYYMKYLAGSYTQYNYDFSLSVDWVDDSSCVRVTWWKYGADSSVLADNPSCAYYCYLPSSFSYEIPDDQMMLSYQPNVVFMSTYASEPTAINLPVMVFSGHWAAPGFADTFDYDSGYSDGYTKGYNDAMAEAQVTIYDSAYADGWHDAAAIGAGGAQMIDIWPLLSAVITMPFTFFSTGLDWTLFANTPYEFGVSAFFGSLLVILMLWKIIQLIMGFGK